MGARRAVVRAEIATVQLAAVRVERERVGGRYRRDSKVVAPPVADPAVIVVRSVLADGCDAYGPRRRHLAARRGLDGVVARRRDPERIDALGVGAGGGLRIVRGIVERNRCAGHRGRGRVCNPARNDVANGRRMDVETDTREHVENKHGVYHGVQIHIVPGVAIPPPSEVHVHVALAVVKAISVGNERMPAIVAILIHRKVCRHFRVKARVKRMVEAPCPLGEVCPVVLRVDIVHHEFHRLVPEPVPQGGSQHRCGSRTTSYVKVHSERHGDIPRQLADGLPLDSGEIVRGIAWIIRSQLPYLEHVVPVECARDGEACYILPLIGTNVGELGNGSRRKLPEIHQLRPCRGNASARDTAAFVNADGILVQAKLRVDVVVKHRKIVGAISAIRPSALLPPLRLEKLGHTHVGDRFHPVVA